MLEKLKLCILAVLFTASNAQTADAPTPVVLELFTSQGCPACPLAGEVLKSLALNNDSILPLSYHIDYWDMPDWKDSYSSPIYTQRQREYEYNFQEMLFTPQMVVNGEASVHASKPRQINGLIFNARFNQPLFSISVIPAGNNLVVNIKPLAAVNADIWEVRFDKTSKVEVRRGENEGRILEGINDVTGIKKLGVWPLQTNTLNISGVQPGQGVAILVQETGTRRILGAGYYK